MTNRKITTGAIVLLFGLFFFALDTKAQRVSGYTSIDYYENTNIVDAYSETDEDYDVESVYGAFVKLSVRDDNWNNYGASVPVSLRNQATNHRWEADSILI